uniref:transcription antitermination factor NusB n=1 Tax=Ndongobacter massiliensis TaxID=1871025 RepID=UPI000B109659|nr:transcription antitermination factor NusB [Ndongobacter massiliensis]
MSTSRASEPKKDKIRRSEEREWLVRLAYETEGEITDEQHITALLQAHALPDSSYLRDSLRSLAQNRPQIDESIATHLSGWSFDRLLRIDLAILRIAVNELCYTRAAPVRVAINEAVELAKRYSDADSYRFVNGLLASIVKESQATDGTAQ